MPRSERLKRGKAVRERYPIFFIVCEGQITEPAYFRDLRHYEKCPVKLEIVPGGTPKTLVEKAVNLKHKLEDADQIWCVFDVDEHPFLAEAKQQARDNHIRVAISNPCFELWALLHFQDQTAHIHRHKVQSLCRKHMPRYEKELPYETLTAGYDDALGRAKKLTIGANPSTNVYELTEIVRSYRRYSGSANATYLP